MTQPPDDRRPDWTPPAWTPPPPRGGQQQNQPWQQQPQGQPPGQPQGQPWQQPYGQQGHPGQQGQQGQQGQPHQPWQPPHGDQGSWELAPGPSSGHGGQGGPGAHRSRTPVLVAAAVVVLALVAGGIFLLRGNNSSTSGGAASPQDAVTKMAAAVAKQDVDGMLSYVDPAESRTVGALLKATRDKFGKTGVLSATGVPAPYLSLALDSVQVQTDKVRPDLAFVTMTGGTVKVTADPSKLPASVNDGQTKPTTESASLAQAFAGTRIGVVQSGGRWYLSPTTTLLEAIRKQTGLPEPDFSAKATATGGSNPEDAVNGLVNALNQKDVRGAVGYLSGKEIPALPYYYDVFASQLKGKQGQVNAKISDVQLSSQDMTNGLKKITIKAATVENGGGGKITYSDGCATTDGRRQCVDARTRSLFGLSEPFFVVEQNDGKWQISPIATVTEYLRTIFADGSADALYRRGNFEVLAPVTATVKVGDTATVQLNDAGYAHIVVTGTPGTCFDGATADESQQFDVRGGNAYSSRCEHFTIPSSGKADAVVEQESLAKATAQVRITKE